METSAPAPAGQEFVLANLSPNPAQRRLALGLVLVLLVGFVIAAGPLSKLPLIQIDAFIPAYGTAIFFTDSITAALLFAQFSVLRSRALLALASGYLLTGLVAIPWTLTFPGVFAAGGPFGTVLQSTAWLYILWHAGFALLVIAYTLLKDMDPIERHSHGHVRAAILMSVGSVAALVCAATALVTIEDAFVPRIMLDMVRLSTLWFYLAGPTATLIILALVLLWLRHRSVLDLWLMVVLCAYAIEVALISFPVATRFSLGWYAGRIYGLLAGSLMLLILLTEITVLYAELLRAVLAERHERAARLMTGDAVSASIAHEVKQPLSAMITSASAGLLWLEHAEPDVGKARAALRRIQADGHRAGATIENIRALFKKDTRNRTSLDVNVLVLESLALVRIDLQKHRIAVETDLKEQLPSIIGDQGQLQQVLVNLSMNAIESMASQDGQRVLCLKSGIQESGSVMVSVEDTGKGLEPSAADAMFNALFTTKAHGMGLGLSICQSIIEAHGGQLRASANIPRGAVFQFTVPAFKDAAS
jgi:signal transduction histidine kinase